VVVGLSFDQLEGRITSMLAKVEPMDRDDFIRWIHESKDPKERSRRKTASFGALYGQLFSMGAALPRTPGDNTEVNTR
jgi:hypothetical protein